MIKDSATFKNEGLAVRKHEDNSNGHRESEKIIKGSQDFQKKIVPHQDPEQAPSNNGGAMRYNS